MPKVRETVGTTRRFWAELTDPDTREPFEPDTLRLEITTPVTILIGDDDEPEVIIFEIDDVEMINTEPGFYYVAYDLAVPGTYHWKYTAFGDSKTKVLTGEIDAEWAL